MTTNHPLVPPGFHDGELAVQLQAGVRADASRLRRMLDRADLSGGAARFLAGQKLAVLSGRDPRGRLWVSPLTAAAGFLEATEANTLRVHASPAAGDPLHDLPAGQQVGLLVIDFSKRRRYRINGWLAGAGDDGLSIEADQAYGNCPQYIRQRDLTTGDDVCTGLSASRSHDPNAAATRPATPAATGGTPTGGRRLTAADLAQVAAADTFFLGTTHPDRGGDASHRGGPPGFVRAEGERHLWWPDYPGNNMFNSFGNLAVDPAAALLFPDFTSGRTLHLSGSAELQRTAQGARGDDGGTGRRVTFTVEHTVHGPPTSLRARHVAPGG